MTALVEVSTSYAGDEKLQQVIIKCLDDDDRTIGKKVSKCLVNEDISHFHSPVVFP